MWDSNIGSCVPGCPAKVCPAGMVWDSDSCSCVTCPVQPCQSGYAWDPVNCDCAPVTPPGCPIHITNTLPQGTTEESYSQQLVAIGGTGPYAFLLISGSLPSGVTLSGTGLLSGTPGTVINTVLYVKATDSLGVNCVTALSFVVADPSQCLGNSTAPRSAESGLFQGQP